MRHGADPAILETCTGARHTTFDEVKPMRQTFSALPLLGLTATLAHGQIPEGAEGTHEPYPEAEGAIGQLLSPCCPGLMLEQYPAEESSGAPRELELSTDPAF